jgi:hypothetical protein
MPAAATPETEEKRKDLLGDEWQWKPLLQYREMGDGTFIVRKVPIGGGVPSFVARVRPGDSIDVHYDFK